MAWKGWWDLFVCTFDVCMEKKSIISCYWKAVKKEKLYYCQAMIMMEDIEIYMYIFIQSYLPILYIIIGRGKRDENFLVKRYPSTA
jgi:hypothetical protein